MTNKKDKIMTIRDEKLLLTREFVLTHIIFRLVGTDNSEQIIDTIIKEYGVELLRDNDRLDEDNAPTWFSGVDRIPSSLANIVCPFCSGKVVAFVDMYKYLLESSGLTEDEIKSKIVRPNSISINLIFPLA